MSLWPYRALHHHLQSLQATGEAILERAVYSNRQTSRSRSREIRASVYKKLLHYVSGPDGPDDGRLVEDGLAIMFGVSRTPIREALQRLEQDGLVFHTSGWYLRPPTIPEARAVFEFRTAIECYAVRLAAQRISPTEIDDLTSLQAQMEVPNLAPETINDLNERFHDRLTAASRNRRLAEGRSSASIKYWAFRHPIAFQGTDLALANRDHREILASITVEDGDTAERIMRRHIIATQEIVLAGLLSLR